MRDLRRRLERAEYDHVWRIAAKAGNPLASRLTRCWTKPDVRFRCPMTSNVRNCIAYMPN